MKVASFLILSLLTLSPHVLAQTAPTKTTKAKSKPAVTIKINENNDCNGNCQVLEVQTPQPISVEVMNAMQIRAAAEQLAVPNPDEIRIKNYLGYIEIDQNPTNVVKIKINGQEKYLLKVTSNDYAPVLKEDDLVMLDRSQFFYFDPKTTIQYDAKGGSIGSSISLYNLNGVRWGATGGTIRGSVGRNLDGAIIYNQWSYLVKFTEAQVERESRWLNYAGRKMRVEALDPGNVGQSITQPFSLGKLDLPTVTISDVKLPEMSSAPVKGDGK